VTSLAFQQDTTYFHSRLLDANAYNKQAKEYLETNPNRAINWAEKSLTLVEQIKARGYMAQGRVSVGLREKTLLTELQAYYILALAYELDNQYNKSVKNMREALHKAEILGDENYTTQLRIELNELIIKERDSKKGLGKIFTELKRGVETVLEEDEIQSFSNDMRGLKMELHVSRAETFVHKKDYENAIQNYLKALDVAYKINDSLIISDLRNRVYELNLIRGNVSETSRLMEANTLPELDSIIVGNNRPKEENLNPLLTISDAHLSRKGFTSGASISDASSVEGIRSRSESLSKAGDYKGAYEALESYASRTQQLQVALRRRWEDSVRTSRKIDSNRNIIEHLKLQNLERELMLRDTEFLIAQKNRQLSYYIIGLPAFIAIILLLYLLFVSQKRATQKLKTAYVDLNETHEKLKSAQTQLVESEKMASLGQLTAGIAHEINNPINFISGNISPLKRDIEELLSLLKQYDELIAEAQLVDIQNRIAKLKTEHEVDFVTQEIEELIQGIEEGSNRTTEIIKGLRNFARLDEAMPKAYDIQVGLDSTLALLKHKTQHIEIVKEYGNIPEVYCLPGKLNQVFMNILTNAIQAMPDAGKIVIRTQIVSPNPGQPERVHIQIQDQGQGIPDKIKNRIFEPFFTTKDVGVGTGLGLAIAKGIIDQHHGEIKIESSLGEGTLVHLFLPINNTQIDLENDTGDRSSGETRVAT